MGLMLQQDKYKKLHEKYMGKRKRSLVSEEE